MIRTSRQRLWTAALVSLSALGISQTVHSAPTQGGREGTCANAATLFPDTNPGPGSLKQVAVPEPTDLGFYVRDRATDILHSKAHFWDKQDGREGKDTCET